MKIRFLGTSGAGFTENRKLPAILIDDTILIDCGEGCLQTLMQHHISLSNISAIFISHLHADHCLGLVSFLWQKAFYDRQNHLKQEISIPIYVPYNMKENLMEILKKTYSSFENVMFQVNIIELPEKCDIPLILICKNIQYSITWQKTIHKPLCYAYRFNNEIVISGDTAPSGKLAKFCQNTKIIIHEATFFDEQSKLAHSLNHSTPKDAAILAVKTQPNILILTHLPVLSEQEQEFFLQNAKEIYSNIFIAYDNWILETDQIMDKI